MYSKRGQIQKSNTERKYFFSFFTAKHTRWPFWGRSWGGDFNARKNIGVSFKPRNQVLETHYERSPSPSQNWTQIYERYKNHISDEYFKKSFNTTKFNNLFYRKIVYEYVFWNSWYFHLQLYMTYLKNGKQKKIQVIQDQNSKYYLFSSKLQEPPNQKVLRPLSHI